MGHTHRDVPSRLTNGVVLTQARCWGDRLARVDVTLERVGDRWRVIEKTATTIAVTAETVPDPAIVALAQPYHAETQTWLDRTVGSCATSLVARDARVRDTAIIDLIQRVQLETGDAEVSLASCFNLNAQLPAGPVTVRDVVGLYVYDNTLVVVEITGAALKAALEHSAKFFRSFEPGKTAQELIDSRIPGYNFDLAEGVDYVIDLRRPVGDRIVDLRFAGVPLDPARRLRVAINNYRHTGGGGYSMYAGAPVLWKSSTEVRDLILDWVERHGAIPTEPTNNWRIVTE
jgi:2',3'-cyclic-nucleotide 2'-phosphodiesterase/3'-nucleotidase